MTVDDLLNTPEPTEADLKAHADEYRADLKELNERGIVLDGAKASPLERKAMTTVRTLDDPDSTLTPEQVAQIERRNALWGEADFTPPERVSSRGAPLGHPNCRTAERVKLVVPQGRYLELSSAPAGIMAALATLAKDHGWHVQGQPKAFRTFIPDHEWPAAVALFAGFGIEVE